MKLRNLLLASGAAFATYWTVKNHEKITEEVQDTTNLIRQNKKNVAAVQENLARVQAYQEPVKEVVADLQQKVRIYQQSISGNLAEIQRVLDKYKK